MSTIWDLKAALTLDNSSYMAGLSESAKKSQATGNSIVSSLAHIGGAVVTGAFAVAGAGVAALGGLMASSIGPASDLNETISKSGVVFGDSARQIEEMGDTAAASLGMTKNAAMGAAATYGNLFRSMGMAEGTSANMSESLVGLASDLASFNNIDPTEALEKLRAGLTGETEPLKSLGVNISAAMIETEALSMGLMKQGGTLTASAKAQASYALIMKQTSLAQGDFARTSGGLANQQRILSATFENVKASIGTALLPVVTQISQTMNKWLSDPEISTGLTNIAAGVATFAGNVISYLPQVIALFQQVGDWFSKNQGVIVGVFAALGVAVAAWAVTTVTSTLAAAGGFAVVWASIWPVIAVMAAVGAAAYLLYQAWTSNFGGIQEITKAVWDGIVSVFNVAVSVITSIVQAFTALLQGDWVTFGTKLVEAATLAWNGISKAIETIGEGIKTVVLSLIKSVIDFFSNVDWAAIGSSIVKGIADGIVAGVRWIVDGVGQLVDAAKAAATGGSQNAAANAVAVQAAYAAKYAGSYGGGRASGGSVFAGTPYIVGERGPELFVPSSTGSIIPNDKLSGGTTNIYNIYGWQGDARSLAQYIEDQQRVRSLML